MGGGGGGGARGGGGGRGGGMGAGPQTFTMDATMLKIERTGQDGTVTATTYKLDGSESSNPGRGGAMQVSHAKIDGDKVVITATTPNGDQVTKWYKDGDWLVNERMMGETAIKTYYKKAS